MSKKEFDSNIKIIDADAPKASKIGFVCYEILPNSPEEEELNKELNFEKQQATDIADQYKVYHHKTYQSPENRGYMVMPVLQFLWGKHWDNMAENFLATLRPSSVRISSGSLTCDAHNWRVTVFLEKDDRTIKKIEQEVEVGLTGCRYGSDLDYYMRGEKIPKHGVDFVFNPRGLKQFEISSKEDK